MPPSNRNEVQNLLDFQDTVQRGDTLKAMGQMQSAPTQAMPMQTMPMQGGGLVSIPIENRFWGGMVSGVAPSVVGRGVIDAGYGTAGGFVSGALTSFLLDKVMGNKTNLRKNLIQGAVPVATSYFRGSPSFLPESDVQGNPYPVGGGVYGGPTANKYGAVGRIGSSIADQFSKSNLGEVATDAALASALLPEDTPEPPSEKEKYKGLDLQRLIKAPRNPYNPLDFDPRNPQRTQKELYDIARGRAPRRRLTERETYKKTARHGGLAGMHSDDFSGRVPGNSDGMEDDQYYAIREAGGPVEGLLAVSPKEYVIPADVMSILGNGNPDAGADDMDRFTKNVRIEAYGTPNQQKELNGLQTINKNLRG